MQKDFICRINQDVLEKFELALQLNKENADDVLEKQIMQYIANSFSRVSQEYSEPKRLKSIDVGKLNADTGKARTKIPMWAYKSQQNNHKIVRAFFQVESEYGVVTLDNLINRCADEKKYPTTYVKNFMGNFNSMKSDGHNTHGKVFEVHNGEVIVWDYIEDVLMNYKSNFCR
ncbi:hypothetical protein CSV69_03795 [Sporosarcina sp. P26b]|uniref:hypothetical protein n=1 Tax=Sporosarcina TaxID=1569 RepID=UPI000A17E9CB|nr:MULTISPECIES: hypothetical protein [Sporosarcina]ARK20464.1 hypothetical protein SporoP32a_02215 [Sporosarcina ureae]PIC74652.1 hypothetical protein CSV76_02020 [Sporosarcina sp. P17b]PIC96655.1 hypothetical protein CSV69_03795 [Sporosarcina sp. P26b]